MCLLLKPCVNRCLTCKFTLSIQVLYISYMNVCILYIHGFLNCKPYLFRHFLAIYQLRTSYLPSTFLLPFSFLPLFSFLGFPQLVSQPSSVELSTPRTRTLQCHSRLCLYSTWVQTRPPLSPWRVAGSVVDLCVWGPSSH